MINFGYSLPVSELVIPVWDKQYLLDATHMVDIVLLQTALCQSNIELTLVTSVTWTQPNRWSMNFKYILLVK